MKVRSLVWNPLKTLFCRTLPTKKRIITAVVAIVASCGVIHNAQSVVPRQMALLKLHTLKKTPAYQQLLQPLKQQYKQAPRPLTQQQAAAQIKARATRQQLIGDVLAQDLPAGMDITQLRNLYRQQVGKTARQTFGTPETAAQPAPVPPAVVQQIRQQLQTVQPDVGVEVIPEVSPAAQMAPLTKLTASDFADNVPDATFFQNVDRLSTMSPDERAAAGIDNITMQKIFQRIQQLEPEAFETPATPALAAAARPERLDLDKPWENIADPTINIGGQKVVRLAVGQDTAQVELANGTMLARIEGDWEVRGPDGVWRPADKTMMRDINIALKTPGLKRLQRKGWWGRMDAMSKNSMWIALITGVPISLASIIPMFMMMPPDMGDMTPPSADKLLGQLDDESRGCLSGIADEMDMKLVDVANALVMQGVDKGERVSSLCAAGESGKQQLRDYIASGGGGMGGMMGGLGGLPMDMMAGMDMGLGLPPEAGAVAPTGGGNEAMGLLTNQDVASIMALPPDQQSLLLNDIMGMLGGTGAAPATATGFEDYYTFSDLGMADHDLGYGNDDIATLAGAPPGQEQFSEAEILALLGLTGGAQGASPSYEPVVDAGYEAQGVDPEVQAQIDAVNAQLGDLAKFDVYQQTYALE